MLKYLRLSGWRGTVTGGFALSLFALCANIALLGISVTKPTDPVTNARRLYSASCSQLSTDATVFHLGINILSTVLLATSNTAMQCMSAPTREEINKAHSDGKWLDIGISSWRNWKCIAIWRRVLCALLAASTLPLHLL